MRTRSFTWLTVLLLMNTATSAGVLLTPGEFTDAYAARLERIDTNMSVQYVRELEIGIVNAQKKERAVYLRNAYRDYIRDPEALEAILGRCTEATYEAEKNPAADRIDLDRIVPVVKDAAYASKLKAFLTEPGHESGRSDIYYEPLNRELHVYYAVDAERPWRYLSRDEVEALGIGPERLNARAVGNLTNLLPGIERRGDGGTYMVTAGGMYETSLLLFDAIWTKDNFDVKGDIVIAVPSRGLLLVTGSKDENGLKTLRRVAEEVVSEENHTLTTRLFVRKHGEWLPFDTPDGTR